MAYLSRLEDDITRKEDVCVKIATGGGNHLLFIFDARKVGVIVPPHLGEGYDVVLDILFSRQEDYCINEWGITARLQFSGFWFKCEVPWQAIYAVNIGDSNGVIWTCSVPAEVLSDGAARNPKTESPIERKFLNAFKKRTGRELQSQVQIGPHRVDFAIEIPRKVVIECDGHAFHEKTKEQAQKDKARDRYLQIEGWAVLRFTGSEIFRNADACVVEVLNLLKRQAS